MSSPNRTRPHATTARIGLEAHARLRELARRRDESMQETLAAAIDRLWREQLLDEVAEDFAALRREPALWKAELEDRAAWDAVERWDDE